MPLEPHYHRVFFHECGHLDNHHILEPDPNNPTRCICDEKEPFRIRLSYQGTIGYVQGISRMNSKCPDCLSPPISPSTSPKMTLGEYMGFLEDFEKELVDKEPEKKKTKITNGANGANGEKKKKKKKDGNNDEDVEMEDAE
ncbi:hypothetical protein ABW19_dt0205597 [Dactylella cylindrospora]|nr:hypothetical protein ABW19_dt0205597 [Dactylella cylindrospora]